MFLKMTKFDTDRVNIDRAILGGVKSAQDDGVTLYHATNQQFARLAPRAFRTTSGGTVHTLH